MNLYEVVQSKIERLISIMLTDGVQPSDMADNIALKPYKSIAYRKEHDKVIGVLVFDDINETNKGEVKMEYTYSLDMRLMRIEEFSENQHVLLWDREAIEIELARDIVEILRTQYTSEQMTKFLGTLPEEIQKKIHILNTNIAS